MFIFQFNSVENVLYEINIKSLDLNLKLEKRKEKRRERHKHYKKDIMNKNNKKY